MIVSLGNYITIYHQNIMNVREAKAGRPRDPALDGAILSAAARQLGELGYARMSLESVAAAAATTVPSLRRRFRNKAELAGPRAQRRMATRHGSGENLLEPVIGIRAAAERCHFPVAVAGVQPPGFDEVPAGVQPQHGYLVPARVLFQAVK